MRRLRVRTAGATVLLAVGVGVPAALAASRTATPATPMADGRARQEEDLERRKAKEQFEDDERAWYRDAVKHPRAPKVKTPPDRSCPSEVGPPTIERLEEAIPGVEARDKTSTRLVSGGDVYRVFAGGAMQRTDEGRYVARGDEGVVYVMRAAVDPCASHSTRSDEAVPIGYSRPGVGVITLTGVKGTAVEFRTSSGQTGSFDVVTRTFMS